MICEVQAIINFTFSVSQYCLYYEAYLQEWSIKLNH